MFDFRRCARILILVLLGVWLAVNVTHDFRLLVRSYTPLPFWDDWITIDHYLPYKHFDLSVLGEQHNEHRIAAPELIFALDDLLFHGRRIFTIVLSCLFYAGVWVLLAQSLLKSDVKNRFPRICAILVAGIFMAWSGSTLVLGSPFQIVWTLLFFGAAGALVSLAKLHETGKPLFCALVILGAEVATFSEVSGIAIWPILIAFALLLGLRKGYIAAVAIAAAASIALYFTHYRFPPSHLALILANPLAFLCFTAAYLGIPFSAISDNIAMFAGFVSMCAFLCALFEAGKRRLLTTRTGAVLSGLYLAILLTAFLTAAGRMDPNNPSSLAAASAHRYIAVPLEGWAVLIMMSVWILRVTKPIFWAPVLAALLFALHRENKMPEIKVWLHNPAYTFFSFPQIAALSFESGLTDSAICRTVLPSPDDVRRDLLVMKRYKLSVFAKDYANWIGKPAQSVFSHINSYREPGAVTVMYPVESGLELVGWSETPRNIFHPEEFVFLNQDRQIVGFGTKLPDELPPGFATLETPSALAWIGFINRAVPSQSITIYRFDARHKALSPIGKPVSLEQINKIQSIAPQASGPVLPEDDWKMSGDWKKDGEDWISKKDGTLVSPVIHLPGPCLTVPVGHGSTVDDMDVRVTGPGVDRTLTSLPMIGADSSRRYWQIHLPEDISDVRIVATTKKDVDWLIVAQPRSCLGI